jgi:hypothetical protein
LAENSYDYIILKPQLIPIKTGGKNKFGHKESRSHWKIHNKPKYTYFFKVFHDHALMLHYENKTNK